MVSCLELGATARAGGVLVGEEPGSVLAYGNVVCDETCCASAYRVGNANGR